NEFPACFGEFELILNLVVLLIEAISACGLVLAFQPWLVVFSSKAFRGTGVLVEDFTITQAQIGSVFDVPHAARHANRKLREPNDSFFIAANNCRFEFLSESFEAVVAARRIAR